MLRHIFSLLIVSCGTLQAQHVKKCGLPELLQTFHERYPNVDLIDNKDVTILGRNTSQVPPPIPVIFHVVLNLEQIAELGGRDGIRKRVSSQLEIINKDFSVQNDISAIPGGFIEVIGNPGISFALARRNIFGYETEGFQIQHTRKQGFQLNGVVGSMLGFSDAKNFTTDGDQAWDPTSYLNIWIINALSENGDYVLGLTIPPSYVNSTLNIPLSEQGIVLHYKAFGVQENGDEAYLPNATGGRTLTHELGHYFGLQHIWGDDGGLCSGNGGKDDGLDDTPLQGDATTYCPDYPLYDDCSNEGDGVMYVNFMDYTPDECVAMFTNEQANKMLNSVLPGGESYSLTQHPKLLEKPLTQDEIDDFDVFPNPAHGSINIYFQEKPRDLKGISISDVLGRKVASIEPHNPLATYTFDTQLLAPGLYYIRCDFEEESRSKCIMVGR